MAHKCKLRYRDIQRIHKGTILLLAYEEGRKTLAFTPTDDVPCGLVCSCGSKMWNATNFGNAIHICPDREMEVEVTDYKAVLI